MSVSSLGFITPTVQKSIVTKYRLNWNRGRCWWADIFLEDFTINSGRIIIHSDWGEWSASWGAMGGRIRPFLLNMDECYIKKNLGRGEEKWLNEELTRKEIEKHIIATRISEPSERKKLVGHRMLRFPHWDKAEARDAWDELDSLFDSCYNSPDAYCSRVIYGDWKFMELFEDEPSPPCITDYPPGLTHFMKEAWPRFQEVIRLELEGEEDGELSRS